MQKKISAFIIIALFTLLNIKAQNIESIKGSIAVQANKEYSYSINFDKDLTSDVNVVVEISNGHFADNSSKKVFTFYSSFLGQKNYSVNIIWANSNFTNGTVSAYTVSNPSKVVKLEKIKHDENEGITKIYNLEMEGSNLFVMGDNVAIKAKLKPSLNNAHKYQWDYSNIYLKLNNLQQYASDVTAYVTALRPVKNFNLPISIVDRKSGNIVQTVYFPITVKPKYFIETNTSDICNNQNISLSIKNIEFTPGATIKWYALSNLSLISGQGSPNAIFKSSGSGKGMARATITYDGESYDANFDDVWIGVPAKPILSVNSAAPGIVQYSAEISCNARKYDKITWSISGGTLNSKTGTTVSAVPSGKGMMSVVATVTNSCGSTSGSTSLTVYNPSSNGGLSMAERSTSETKTYEIYSLNGNLIHKYFSINFNPKEINIPNGIYIIYSTDINGKEINSQKVIINN